MGPRTVFDKSALQMLTIDESVWFDSYLTGIVTPLFYVETLSDLEKKFKPGVSADHFVSSLAAKTPSDAVPNVFHRTLIIAEMAGEKIQMDTRPIIAGGVTRQTTQGKISVEVNGFAESEALNRWSQGEFEGKERELARKWRADVVSFDSESLINLVKNILPVGKKISNLIQLKDYVDQFCKSKDVHTLQLLLTVLEIPDAYHKQVIMEWEKLGKPSLDQFLPYSTHVFKVDLMYFLGIYRGFVSGVRKSNKSDMAYLYYLPFCQLFVSGDKLHATMVPLFLNNYQMYMTSEQLKASLQEFDIHFDNYPDAIKELGVMSFAGYPPHSINNAVTGAWDKLMRPDWRKISAEHDKELGKPRDKETDRQFIEDLEKQMKEGDIVDPSVMKPGHHPGEPDIITIKRTMPVHKGKWRMVSKEVEDLAKKEPNDSNGGSK